MLQTLRHSKTRFVRTSDATYSLSLPSSTHHDEFVAFTDQWQMGLQLQFHCMNLAWMNNRMRQARYRACSICLILMFKSNEMAMLSRFAGRQSAHKLVYKTAAKVTIHSFVASSVPDSLLTGASGLKICNSNVDRGSPAHCVLAVSLHVCMPFTCQGKKCALSLPI